ncbi:MAG: hypothetical protein ACFFD2_11765, partial [Promethearchaeota archaeon]
RACPDKKAFDLAHRQDGHEAKGVADIQVYCDSKTDIHCLHLERFLLSKKPAFGWSRFHDQL